MKRLISIL